MAKPIIATVFGTRPEAIKMASVVHAASSDPDLDHRLVVTAQHRELLDDVLELFSLAPDHDLDLMRERQTLGYLTAAALDGLLNVLGEMRPDFVLVHGDTTTTLCAALAAFYLEIPFGHVEAGLRTTDIHSPFPEEFNRRSVDLIADQLYCPTPGAAANLEQVPGLAGEIFLTGNTAIDAVRYAAGSGPAIADPVLAEFARRDGPLLLLTAHRRENWGEPMAGFCRALLEVLDRFPAARTVVCWHPNPEVRAVMSPLLSGHQRILLADPPRFDDFVRLMSAASLILTDSGGIQEEVSALGRFALVLREETERPEAVESGFARVVGRDPAKIVEEAANALPDCLAGRLPGNATSPFGDGMAAERIIKAVRYFLSLDSAPPAPFGG